MKEFPTILRQLRKQARMSQPELAEKLGISRSAVSIYECGSREPNFAMLEAISDLFNVDMNTLTGTEPIERGVTDRDIKFALFGDAYANDELYEEVKDFAQFLQHHKK